MFEFIWTIINYFRTYFFISNNKYIYESVNNTKKSIVKYDEASKTYKTYTKFVSTHFDTDKINVYENEKKWLLRLKNSKYFPYLLYYNDQLRMIVTTDMGRKLTNTDLQKIDIHDQCNNIIKELKKYNCRHNDIKPDELVFQNGILKLVDFGWAHDLNEENPSYWPSCLGDKFKCTPYNDECSIYKSIDYIQQQQQQKKRRYI